VLQKLAASPLPAVKQAAADLKALVDALKAHQLPASISIDLLDLSGYGYYHGVGYALFWNKAGLEVGRGGCYRTARGEEAVGFTLYLNELLDHLPAENTAPVKKIPYGTAPAEAEALQREGFITMYGE